MTLTSNPLFYGKTAIWAASVLSILGCASAYLGINAPAWWIWFSPILITGGSVIATVAMNRREAIIRHAIAISRKAGEGIFPSDSPPQERGSLPAEVLENLQEATAQVRLFCNTIRAAVEEASVENQAHPANPEGLRGTFAETFVSMAPALEAIRKMMRSERESTFSTGTRMISDESVKRDLASQEGSISGIARALEEVYRMALITQEKAGESSGVVRLIANALREVAGARNRVTQVIGELKAKQSGIQTLAEEIGDISRQARMLAMNASIQAAQARENGAAFGVVAEEFGKLSERVHIASGRISETAGSVSNETAALEKENLAMMRSVESAETLITGIEEAFSGFVDKAEATVTQVAHCDTMVRMAVSIIEHMELKAMVYRALLLGEGHETLGDHANCKFEEWQDSEGKRLFGNNPLFLVLREPHEKIHEAALDILRSIGLGNWKNDGAIQERISQSVIDMEIASSEFFTGFQTFSNRAHMGDIQLF